MLLQARRHRGPDPFPVIQFPYLHKHLSDHHVIVILKYRAEHNRDAVLFCLDIPADGCESKTQLRTGAKKYHRMRKQLHNKVKKIQQPFTGLAAEDFPSLETVFTGSKTFLLGVGGSSPACSHEFRHQ